ncbi:MAG: membrane protein [Nitrospirales bacterium]|nr:MAG: membrane protein [Nitrospirales bacterium]
MFLMKKIIGELLLPLPLCLEIMGIGLVLLWFTNKKWLGKVLVSVGFAVLMAVSTEAISGRIIHTLESQYGPLTSSQIQTLSVPSNSSKSPQIVVLAGGLTGDPTLPLHLQILHASRERLLEGVRLYRLLPGSQLILTGGLGFQTVPEATVLSRVAQTYGVKKSDIVLEVQSRDTKDHPRFVSALVKDDPFILVTSAYHMPRAMKLFAKYNLYPLPSPIGHWKPDRTLSFWSWIPGSGGLRLADRATHEYLGIAWAWLQGQI